MPAIGAVFRLAAACAPLGVLAACASAPAPAGAAPSGAEPAVSRSAPRGPAFAGDDRPGYVFVGEDWRGRIVFGQPGADAALEYAHAVRGVEVAAGELDFGAPWLAGGVRRFTGETPDGAQIEIAMTAGPCETAGESGGHFVQVRLAAARYAGCAREIGPSPLWSASIGALLPAIEACRHELDAFDAVVLHAAIKEEAARVRLRAPNGARFDCAAEAGGAQPQIHYVTPSMPALPGEGDPVFIPFEIPDAGEACRLYERVEDGQGRLLGALGHESCAPATG